MSEDVRIGLIGTGFGRRVMMPVFSALAGANVVAVCSGHHENAEATAAEFSISGVYTDFEEMYENEELDLVLITSPPHLHLPMSKMAFDRNIHVLCEKPTACGLDEAQEMLNCAQDSGALHLIDHELRFHPTFQKLKELVDEGYVGPLEKVRFSIEWGFPLTFEREWSWWFDIEKGGGLLGAIGSHQIDLIRWILGEFKHVKGQIHISEKFRKLPDSNEQKEVTADDYAAINAELECGAIGSLRLNSSARARGDGHLWQIAIHGVAGSLIWDDRKVLTGIRHAEDPEDLTQPEKVENIPGLPDQIFPSSFAHFAPKIIDAIQTGKLEFADAPTFYDGMRVQAVLDAVRKSDQQGGWMDCNVT
jgi:predicted dehydrogenase